jgi:hypothetical protein
MSRQPYTREKGPFRILIETNDDPQKRNGYFEVSYYADGLIRREILFVRDSRIAYNRAIVKHGRSLLNVEDLERGHLVVGARS